MEAKVSLVVTCFNKVDIVANMLASILNQKWNTVEVILVDDGSTDGTSDVLAAWKHKLEKRGYEVKIIHQQNAGVSAAAKTGMENITGEYMCLLDGDDELDPEYVSTMACWLTDHKEYDFCRCTYKRKQLIDGQVEVTEGFLSYEEREIETYDTENRMLNYILRRIRPAAWVYMVKTAYLRHCGLPKNYHTDIRTNQESNFVIPLFAGGGKVKSFPVPLYIYNYVGEGADPSRNYTKEKWDYIALKEKNWFALLKITIQSLDIEPEFMKKALFLANFNYHCAMCSHARQLAPTLESGFIESAVSLLNQYYAISFDANKYKDVFVFSFIQEIVVSKMFNLPLVSIPKFSGKVIAYGVLGQRGKRYLHLLNDTSFIPEQLWDINGDNVVVQKPNFSLLKNEDLLVVFPYNLKLDVICHQISFVDLYMNLLSKKHSKALKKIK